LTSKTRPSPWQNPQFSTTDAFSVAWVAENVPPVLASCMCSRATAPSWHDEQTAAVGEIRRLSVASVVENGVTLVAGTGYVVDVASGILYRGSTQGVQCFASGLQNTVITYRAGELRPSAVARKVAKNGAARMWQGRQMPHPALDDLGAEMVAPLGVLTPLELAGYMKLKRPGLA
jgi:hypothetical protein